MHSHSGLQEMRLLAAPLIVRSAEDLRADRQEVVLFLQDFSFRAPEEILAGLVNGGHGHAQGVRTGQGMEMAMPMAEGHDAHEGHGGGHAAAGSPGLMTRFMTWLRGGHAQNQQAAATVPMPAMMHDLNDVDFDAYLANERTLADPEVMRVEKSGRVLLRVINGSTGTVFHIDTGEIEGELVAVDGNPVEPIRGRRFGLAMAQRIDLLLTLPAGEGAWPVLACREGDRIRTGLILATAGGEIAKIAEQGETMMPAFGVELERRLRAVHPLATRPVDRRLELSLTGDMARYVWGIDGKPWGQHDPLSVRTGERVEVVMRNMTEMAHPMHLHGHHFQVTAIGDETLSGAMRDTVHVPPMSHMTFAFDADNPGRWAFHCHNLLHMAVGMMTELHYEA
jgi:FtsP/CotA-like multicopper oxidase with cupredoxin domain